MADFSRGAGVGGVIGEGEVAFGELEPVHGFSRGGGVVGEGVDCRGHCWFFAAIGESHCDSACAKDGKENFRMHDEMYYTMKVVIRYENF